MLCAKPVILTSGVSFTRLREAVPELTDADFAQGPRLPLAARVLKPQSDFEEALWDCFDPTRVAEWGDASLGSLLEKTMLPMDIAVAGRCTCGRAGLFLAKCRRCVAGECTALREQQEDPGRLPPEYDPDVLKLNELMDPLEAMSIFQESFFGVARYQMPSVLGPRAVQVTRRVTADRATGALLEDLSIATCAEEQWHQLLPPQVRDIEVVYHYTPGVARLASSGSPGCMLLFEQREWQTQLFRPDMTSALSLAQWRRTQMTDVQGRTTV